jgi:hypothetical protein
MIGRRIGIAIVTAACLGLAGCYAAAPPMPPPPPPQAETIPNPPVSATPLIWQPGHWDWTGGGYSWVAGQYIPHDGHSMWMPGYWAESPGGWVWQPAHWLQ